ncbi:hypothetical protein HQ403_01260 [Candidatus Kaiserbacteria bacterium]|nr:hypothetical protein [Candidatus Kaiserbacteria bacterium]
MVSKITLFALLALIISFATSNPSLAGSDLVASGETGSTFFFQDWRRDRMVQLGDNRGNFSDVKGFVEGIKLVTGKQQDDFLYFEGDTFKRKFALEKASSNAKIQVKMLSLAKPGGKYECPATLHVNDTKFNLRDADNVGSGKMTVFSADIMLLKGENTIKIVEGRCEPGNGLNESVLVEGKISF